MAMYTKHPLPYPGQQEVPFFNGKDATQFIEDIKFMFVNYRVSQSKWIKIVLNYCRPLTRSKAKNFAAYKDSLQNDYKKEFLNQWKFKDKTQKRLIVVYLQKLFQGRDKRTNS